MLLSSFSLDGILHSYSAVVCSHPYVWPLPFSEKAHSSFPSGVPLVLQLNMSETKLTTILHVSLTGLLKHTSNNILLPFPQSFNLRVVFDCFLCMLFLPFTSPHSSLPLGFLWIYHLPSSFIGIVVCDLFLPQLFRFLDDKCYDSITFVL